MQSLYRIPYRGLTESFAEALQNPFQNHCRIAQRIQNPTESNQQFRKESDAECLQKPYRMLTDPSHKPMPDPYAIRPGSITKS